MQRTKYLPAHVEMLLAASEIAEAREAAEELGALADRYGMDVLKAMAQHAKGAVALAEGDARGTIQALRSAQEVWQRIAAPDVRAAAAMAATGEPESSLVRREDFRIWFVEIISGASPAGSAATDAAEDP